MDSIGAVALFVIMLILFVLSVVVYFLPSIIAAKQNHKNSLAIFALNLFAGWTMIGWVGALVWALAK